MLAGLAILGSMKGQTVVAFLIPILALGVPIIDTILAPLRRFIRGQKLFGPDRMHIHHRLMSLGLDHRSAVLLLYGFSIILGAFALILVNIHDVRAAIILALLWVAIFLGIRKLGYMEYLAMDKFSGWLRDLKDVTGISQKRRSFLSLQMDMGESRSIDELWEKVCPALTRLKFQRTELHLHAPAAASKSTHTTASASGAGGRLEGGRDRASSWSGEEERRCSQADRRREPRDDRRGGSKGGGLRAMHYAVLSGNGTKLVWTCEQHRRQSDVAPEDLMVIELPLKNEKGPHLGTLRLIRDLGRAPLDYNTLRRVEQLRRSLIRMLAQLNK
jgi:UDP-GlcNAc:undecaprenyl-phosphate GlcNAc-1-phosphate transferase